MRHTVRKLAALEERNLARDKEEDDDRLEVGVAMTRQAKHAKIPIGVLAGDIMVTALFEKDER